MPLVNPPFIGVQDKEALVMRGTVVGGRVNAMQRFSGQASDSTGTLQTRATFTIPRAGRYMFTWESDYTTAAAATGLQVAMGFTGTVGGDNKLSFFRMLSLAGDHTFDFGGALDTKIGSSNQGSTTRQYFRVFGILDAQVAGTFTLQFCSGVPGSNVIVGGDSYVGLVEEV
jgi:hypothetical protein